MNKMHYIGLDVHKESIAVAIAPQNDELRSYGIIGHRRVVATRMMPRLLSRYETESSWREYYTISQRFVEVVSSDSTVEPAIRKPRSAILSPPPSQWPIPSWHTAGPVLLQGRIHDPIGVCCQMRRQSQGPTWPADAQCFGCLLP